MPTTTVTIAAAVGLHARPAAQFVQAVKAAGLPVTIAKPGLDPVDAASILQVMALGAKHGDTVELAVTGDGAEAALAALADLLARDLDAE
ncbi:MAG: HPr family phosphocarrier protein [Propionibacteriaceae bacterium]|nr:HPr family phosphocarrier protein [Propionibacteriaceae bacterium]